MTDQQEGTTQHRWKDGSVSYDGGSVEDQAALLNVHHVYMQANDTVDLGLLAQIWDQSPENIWFNANGHAYYGFEDWSKIWDYLRPMVKLRGMYTPGALRIVIRGDMGVVISEGAARYKDWVGDRPKPAVDQVYYRLTQVCVRRPEGWRVIHAHFSPLASGPRTEEGGA